MGLPIVIECLLFSFLGSGTLQSGCPEIDKLLELLQKANEEGLLKIYDENKQLQEVDWIYGDYENFISINIKKF